LSLQTLFAFAWGLPLSPNDLLGSLNLNGLFGDNSLQTSDHSFELFEPSNFFALHAAEFLAPLIEGVGRNPVLATQFGGRGTRLALGKNLRDLFIGESRFAHVALPSDAFFYALCWEESSAPVYRAKVKISLKNQSPQIQTLTDFGTTSSRNPSGSLSFYISDNQTLSKESRLD
jgi:hypothetical protein